MLESQLQVTETWLRGTTRDPNDTQRKNIISDRKPEIDQYGNIAEYGKRFKNDSFDVAERKSVLTSSNLELWSSKAFLDVTQVPKLVMGV